MQEERTSAIVLRTRVHGESDKIVTFLTQDWGKITGIAKGAKRSRRRFVNVLEPFTHIRLRFRPSRSDDLAFILGCELVQAFRRPSQDLQRFALASYMVELTDVMVAGREAGQEIYALLLHALASLEESSSLSSLFLSAFELRLLVEVGYAPNLKTCHVCGTSISPRETDGPALLFSPSLSGLLCPRCDTQGGATFRLSPATLSLLQTWLASEHPPGAVSADRSPRIYQETRSLVSRLLAQHLPRPLKSLAFLEHIDVSPAAAVPGQAACIDDVQSG